MAAGFAGSPTILIDGRDLFPQSTMSGRAAWHAVCTGRRAGSVGVPAVEDMMSALSERVDGR